MKKNEVARAFTLAMGLALVMAITGCAFSGPGTHIGGSGVEPVTTEKAKEEKSAKASAPEPEEPDLPVLR
ncbi:MAG: hypothetical protein JNN02_00365 [Tabrizicola sp.]|nr:hypothetical protein [Tabrizicola sp.]HMS93925.1 hypothetical protein [Tabrizicola sp.]